MNNPKPTIKSKSGFEYLSPRLGSGTPPPAGWGRIDSCPMLIFVGVMGTGKTSAIKNLQREIDGLHVLPDRRVLTEKLIVSPLQKEKKGEVRPLSRPERVPYIQAYKEKYPAGMGYALTQLYLDPTECKNLSLFDGLRGKEEIEYVLNTLPNAQFVFFNVSELARAKRLLKRADPYDQRSLENKVDFKNGENSFLAIGIPEAKEMFSEQEEEILWDFIYEKKIAINELFNVLKLMLLEKSLYDKEAARQVLSSAAPERTLFIDTDLHDTEEVAQKIKAQLLEKA